MILAVRMAVEGMVEDLIKSDADINMTDEWGKSKASVFTVVIYMEVCKSDTSLFMSGSDLH